MIKPLVALIGRPNVGKSTFFNRVVGRRISIVEDKPGVTRDRLYADANWNGYAFTLIDTGGLEIKSDDTMWKHIREQAEIAMDLCDVIIFFVDGKTGLSHEDFEVADLLRKSLKPVIIAVNKIDNNEMERVYEFYSLGFDVFGISSEHGKGIGDLLDDVVKQFKVKVDETTDENVINIAVVGRPNAGKSSLVNKLLGFERCIVSDVAGTTRDAIDTQFVWNEQTYNIIDTAGMRRQRSIDENVEQYSVMRALTAVRRADVVVVMIDSSEDVTEQDVRICGYVHEQGKPSVICMNKWDLVEKDSYTLAERQKKLDESLKFMSYYESIFISAKTGQRVDKIMSSVNFVLSEARKRITTGVLNDVVRDAVSVTEPPSHNGRALKIYFATQQCIEPPTFIFFVNNSDLLHFSYKRYLENSLRKAFGFKGTPVHLIIRNKGEEDY
ncbi:MAG: ribosome biogenesis GTPase Der [Clostridia bacterium]